MQPVIDLRYNRTMSNPNIIDIVNDHSIVQATAVKLSEGLRPRRVVLRHLEDQRKFVVHNELMAIRVETREHLHEMGRSTYDHVICEHDGFDNGHYVEYGPGWGRTQEEAYEKAKEVYKERAGRY